VAGKKRKGTEGRGLGGWPEPRERRLDPEQVVRAGLELLDAEGFDGLTMRRLAERLGVQAASLYNHVADKGELLARMADAICAEIPDLDPARSWREQAETLARHTRRALMRYRDGARVMAATPPLGPQRLRLIEQGLRAGVAAGLPGPNIADAAFVLNSYIVGFVLDEAGGEPRDPAAARRQREAGRQFMQSLPKEQFPTLVALADALMNSPSERRFELGLAALLDGLEQRLGLSGARKRPNARR
jgi:TetR/AcrR family transcriptional regulator, tetracycline repressor protein